MKIRIIILFIVIILLIGCIKPVGKQGYYTKKKGEIGVSFNENINKYEVYFYETKEIVYIETRNANIVFGENNDIIYNNGKLTFVVALNEVYR